MGLSYGSLFSGAYDGIGLGLEWAGHGPCMWQIELESFRREQLSRNWPGVRRWADVRDVDGRQLPRVDLICGGFPCQDVSSAGPRTGLDGARSGLWWQFARVVGEHRPAWVVVENVASGATKWVDPVRRSLEQLGYETLPIPLRASDVGAPHRRARIFIVGRELGDPLCKRSQGAEGQADQGRAQSATRSSLGVGQANTDKDRRQGERVGGLLDRQRKTQRRDADRCGGARAAMADPDGGAVRKQPGRRRGQNRARSPEPVDAGPKSGGHPQCRLGRDDDGLPCGLECYGRWPAGKGDEQYEWEPPRALPRSNPDNRRRLEALGDSVVPQCMQVVGELLYLLGAR